MEVFDLEISIDNKKIVNAIQRGLTNTKIEIYSSVCVKVEWMATIIQRTEQGNEGCYYKVLTLEIEWYITLQQAIIKIHIINWKATI